MTPSTQVCLRTTFENTHTRGAKLEPLLPTCTASRCLPWLLPAAFHCCLLPYLTCRCLLCRSGQPACAHGQRGVQGHALAAQAVARVPASAVHTPWLRRQVRHQHTLLPRFFVLARRAAALVLRLLRLPSTAAVTAAATSAPVHTSHRHSAAQHSCMHSQLCPLLC